MLFRNLFIATLAALAFVGCNDDKDIIEPVPAEANDVNVVFAAASGFAMSTKAAEGGATTPTYSNKYKTVESTENVQEYCIKTKVDDQEFVINDLTVFVFDNSGALVKTSYFDDKNKDGKKSAEGGNSIIEFGGIVLKAGTYKFILAGNLSSSLITKGKDGSNDFEKYKNATIGVDVLNSANPNLPMIKVLDNITLSAQKVTASATLNLIGDGGEVQTVSEAQSNGAANQTAVPNVGKAIKLERRVARVQLHSLAFNWLSDLNPDLQLTLKNIYLVNASKTTKLVNDTEGVGYAFGDQSQSIWLSNEMLNYGEGATEVNSYFTPVSDFTALSNKDAWKELVEGTAKSSYYFYAFPRSGVNGKDSEDWTIKLVLECNLSKEDTPEKTVYYYVPFKKEGKEGVLANQVYNVNVTVTGDGSDVPGKKKETEEVSIEYTVAPWANYYIQTEEANPQGKSQIK